MNPRNPHGQFISKVAAQLTAGDDDLGFAAMALGYDQRRDHRQALENYEQVKASQTARRAAGRRRYISGGQK